MSNATTVLSPSAAAQPTAGSLVTAVPERAGVAPVFHSLYGAAAREEWSVGEVLALLDRTVPEPQREIELGRFRTAVLELLGPEILRKAPHIVTSERPGPVRTLELERWGAKLLFEIHALETGPLTFFHLSPHRMPERILLLPGFVPDGPWGRVDSAIGPREEHLEGSFGSSACVCASPTIEACLRSIAGYRPEFREGGGELAVYAVARGGFFEADRLMVADAEHTAELRSLEPAPALRVGTVRWSRSPA